MNAYESMLLGINSANLENVRINEEIAARSQAHEHDSDQIIPLLTEILEVLKRDRG